MGRFLLFFSYIGTNYNGLQRQMIGGAVKKGSRTIQAALEEALSTLEATNEVKLVTSSRTDSGVHALCNSAQVDLQHRQEDREFSPLIVTAMVNKTLAHNNHDIRVTQTRLVRDDFHCRFLAVARHYMYRLGVVKNALPVHWADPLPAMEVNRCLMVVPPLDVNRLHLAGRVFSGTHDFSKYTNPSVLSQPHVNPVKTVGVAIRRGNSLLSPHHTLMDNHFDIWEIHISAGSFLHKQVRKMVSVMISCAKGKITLDDIRATLNCPKRDNSVMPIGRAAVPGGLYLKHVQYHPSDLEHTLPPGKDFDSDISRLQPHRFQQSRRRAENCKTDGDSNGDCPVMSNKHGPCGVQQEVNFLTSDSEDLNLVTSYRRTSHTVTMETTGNDERTGQSYETDQATHSSVDSKTDGSYKVTHEATAVPNKCG